MRLKKLDTSFYIENAHLKEALDNHNGNWEDGKTRGYGIVVVTIGSLTFAIPLRTNIRHSAAYITVKTALAGVKGKGLDFSKALLITKAAYISNEPFNIPKEEHKKLANKEHHITHSFEKYAARYCSAIKNRDRNILNSIEYRFSTLINYHTELGLE